MLTTIDQINQVYVEATSYCNLHCPQCPRHDNDGYLTRGLTLGHLDFDRFLTNLELHKMTGLERLTFLGDHGDIMMHPRARDFFSIGDGQYRIEAVTNGGMRDPRWWGQLAQIPNLLVVFSVDGLADTNHVYRINSDWHRTMANAQAFIDAGGTAEWHCVVFQHNEHQLPEIQDLSQRMGFRAFHVTHTGRSWWKGREVWPVKVEGQHLYDIYPSSKVTTVVPLTHKDAVIKIRQQSASSPEPNCWLSHGKIYVNYLGHVVPCSMTSAMTWRPDIESALWRRIMGDVNLIDLNQYTLSEILHSGFYNQRLQDSFSGRPFTHSACVSQCTDATKLGRAICQTQGTVAATRP